MGLRLYGRLLCCMAAPLQLNRLMGMGRFSQSPCRYKLDSRLSANSTTGFASLAAMAGCSLFSSPVFCSILMTWYFTVEGSTQSALALPLYESPRTNRRSTRISARVRSYRCSVCGGGHLHPHHRNRKVRPRQGRQLERFKYRQRWFRRKLGREILHSTAFAVTFYFSLR